MILFLINVFKSIYRHAPQFNWTYGQCVIKVYKTIMRESSFRAQEKEPRVHGEGCSECFSVQCAAPDVAVL